MKHTSLASRALASVIAAGFLFASCSNALGDAATSDTIQNTPPLTETAITSATSGAKKDGLLIEFTGNPAYDITLLNDYWAANGTPFDADDSSNTGATAQSSDDQNVSANPAISAPQDYATKGFGDVVANFTVGGLLKWVGGTVLSSGLSTGAGLVFTGILDALGLVKSTTSYFEEIIGKLDRVQNQLNTTQEMIEEMGTRVYETTKREAALTRYYQTMQNRDSQYNKIYINAMTCWNNIFDALLLGALNSQYDDQNELRTKLVELNTKQKRLAYLKSFIDQDSWKAADTTEQVKLADTPEAKKFNAYFEEHKQELSDLLKAAIKKWGDDNATGAQSVFKLCLYLVQNHGAANENFNMFQVYDKYAQTCFVWEQEGYNFRQQMRDQDGALIAMTAPLAYWYYAITQTLNINSSNCLELKKYIDNALSLTTNYPVVKHDLPTYQYYGSRWVGQTFTGTIMQHDYCASIDSYMNSGYELGQKYYKQCLYLNINYPERYRSKTNPAVADVEKRASEMGMPGEWYREMFDAYTVNSGVVRKKTIMQIFAGLGFKLEGGGELPITSYVRNSEERLFVTSDTNMADSMQTPNTDRDYYVYVPAVLGNSNATVEYQDDLSLNGSNLPKNKGVICRMRVKEIWTHKARLGRRYYTHERRVPEAIISKYGSYRKFYYPVKAN